MYTCFVVTGKLTGPYKGMHSETSYCVITDNPGDAWEKAKHYVSQWYKEARFDLIKIEALPGTVICSPEIVLLERQDETA